MKSWLLQGLGLWALAQVGDGNVQAAPAGFDAAAIEKRFVELRDGRGLGCLLERSWGASQILEPQLDHMPALAVRIAAFAQIERARHNGETPLLSAIEDALGALAAVDDVEGLRQAFEQADRITARWPGLQLPDSTLAYRARARLPVPPSALENHTYLLETIQEMALAGDVTSAAALYQAKVRLQDVDSDYASVPHVGALAALGRIEALRAVIKKHGKAPNNRYLLAVRWLAVALRQKASLQPALDSTLAATTVQTIGTDLGQLLLVSLRTGRAGELAPLRKHVITLLQQKEAKSYSGLFGPMYRAVLSSGDAADRAALEALIPADEARQIRTLREAPLDELLAQAKVQKSPEPVLASAWVRHIEQGASDPTFAAHFEAASCPPRGPVAGPPTPPEKMRLSVTEKERKPIAECQPIDTKLRLKRDKDLIAEETLKGECSGACTAAEKKSGARQLREIQKAIRRGEASDSETDYSFTDCLFSGTVSGRIDQVGGRDVAILVDRYIGPHSSEQVRYKLALEVCGRIFVSKRFAERYTNDWKLEELSVRESADRSRIEVLGTKESWRGVIYRLTLPACPSQPIEETISAE